MAIKRRLTGIRLDKIAAVDRPCQQHATVAIIKRASDLIAKDTEGAIKWLKAAIALHKKHMDGTAPTTGPAGEKSQMLMMEQMEKALGELEGSEAPTMDMAKRLIAKKTFQEALHAQLVSEKISDTFWRAFENQWAVREAFRTALTDEIAEGGDGSEAVDGFTTAMQQIASLAADAAREAANTDDATLEAAVESAVSKWLQQEKPTMKKFTTLAALSAAVSSFAVAKSTAQDAQDILDSAEGLGADGIALLPDSGPIAKRTPAANPEVDVLKRQVAVLSMPADVRKHYDGLAEDAQTAFLAKSADAQKAEVEAANATDPVVYKCKDGTEIRKSDGNAVLMMAKRLDNVEAENAVLKGQVGEDSIKKRAAEFTNLPNAEAIVKAADLMPEADRATYLDAMRAANKAAAPRFQRLGHAGGGVSIEKGADDPETRMGAIVKRFRDADPALSEAAAVVKAAATPEYQEAYRDSVAHQLPGEAQ